MNTLEWSPQSPDLSPIEKMWAMLKLRVSESRPKNIHELKQIIEEKWQLFSIDKCKKLTLSLPNRLAKMSLNNGDHCSY